MTPTTISGVEAACAAAEDAGVRLAAGVPGFPINGLFTALQAAGIGRWQFNEKIAFELALGASACGDRALVISKHVGINVMADPLVISATHSIGAGIVVIAGDDVGVLTSQNEQDSRWYGELAEIPVFDPSNVAELYDAILEGFLASEQISAPALVRVTEPVLTDRGTVNRRKIPEASKGLDKAIWNYTMFGKRQKYVKEGLAVATQRAQASPLNRIVRRERVGLISSGRATAYAAEAAAAMRLSHLSLAFVCPFPRRKVEDFVREMEVVLVCEEASPFVESHLSPDKLRGKLTGHLPMAGPLDVQLIMDAAARVREPRVSATIEPETLEARGFARQPCDRCPYLPVYEAIKGLGVRVASDVGCSILTANPPFSMVDVACSLGSPVSVACGFREKGVAMLGDFGLLHTGMQALLNARLNGYGVLTVVFINQKAAMTGGQAIPDVTGVLKAVFADDCEVVEAAGLTVDQLGSDLARLLLEPGLKIYAVRGTCPNDAGLETRSP